MPQRAERVLSRIDKELENAGFAVSFAATGNAVLEMAATQFPSVVVLDSRFEDVSGTDVCRALKSNEITRGIPVMFFDPDAGDIERIVAFELGAEDYVGSGCSSRELVLRVNSLARRSTPPPEQSVLKLGMLAIDRSAYKVYLEGTQISLTATEYRLIAFLAENRHRVQSRGSLLEQIWSSKDEVELRTVDTHVRRLREKLGMAGAYIETVRGVGYRFALPETNGASVDARIAAP